MPSTAQNPRGRRLVVDIVDDIAEREPDRPIIYQQRATNAKDGWAPLTVGQFARAVDHVAHIINSTIKKGSTEKFPTLAYIGPSDARYCIILTACIKAGAQAFFISPRNSTEAQLSLLEATNCSHLWLAESFVSLAKPWVDQRPLNVWTVPEVEDWVNSTPEPFDYQRTFEEAEWEPCVVLHTSGSTGIPKPIVVRNGSVAIADKFWDLPGFAFTDWARQTQRIFIPMPFFHAAGVLGAFICQCIFYERALALPPADKPVHTDLIRDCLDHADVDSALLPPSAIVDLYESEDGLAKLRKLKYLATGGGSLPRDIGDSLVRHGVFPRNIISSTEVVPYALLAQSDPSMWSYFNFNDEVMGSHWRKVEGEEVYELVFKRKHPTLPLDQPAFYTFPDAQEFATGDLYKPHPELPSNWQYYGRADDIIVFTNGEKLNPLTIQEKVSGYPGVKGALVVGQQRFQAALILEPSQPINDTEAANAFIDQVWPVIEEANEVTVAHGRIDRRLVMVADPHIPFSRAPKGTIQRRATIKAYEKHIEQLYKDAAEIDVAEGVPLDFSSKEALAASLVTMLRNGLKHDGIGLDTELFTLGIDSLQIIHAARLLEESLKISGIQLDSKVIGPRAFYLNSSATRLATHLLNATHCNGTAELDEDEQTYKTMESFLAKYTKDLPATDPSKPEPLSNEQTVLITGTTGSLGAYMLDMLCRSNYVKKIVALNRGKDGGASRQGPYNLERGLVQDFSKVEFLGADLSLPDFGLGSAKYSELLGTVDRIVHNAWPVNFNIGLESFEPSIRGVRHLVDFSNAAARKVPVVFVSSVGTVGNWDSKDPVPEEAFTDFKLATMNYGRSKQLGSLILDAARENSGVPSASIRVGQIAGPKGKKGRWNPQEMIPTVFASSLYLGVLPDNPAAGKTIDWMPIEDVAAVVLEIAGAIHPVSVSDIDGYFHLANPKKTTWSELIPAMRGYYGERIKDVVSFSEWVAALEKSAQPSPDFEKNPGIKLLDTFRGFEAAGPEADMANLGTKRSEAISPTMASFKPITPELIKNWCEQWNY